MSGRAHAPSPDRKFICRADELGACAREPRTLHGVKSAVLTYAPYHEQLSPPLSVTRESPHQRRAVRLGDGTAGQHLRCHAILEFGRGARYN